MITIFKSSKQGLQQLDSLRSGCWVHLVDPSQTDLAYVEKNASISSELLRAPLDIHEFSRVEQHGNQWLIILRVSQFGIQSIQPPFITVPLGIILTPSVVVTVCWYPVNLIDSLAASPPHGFTTSQPGNFVCTVLTASSANFIMALQSINDRVDQLENRLQQSLQNKEVLSLLAYQKSLTHFITALRSNSLMLERLEKTALFTRRSGTQKLIEDVNTEIKQATAMTEISSGILSQMMDAFASIISNNLNIVMKFMAAITIILSMPMLVASIYGMNVSLPFESSEYAFLLVAAISLVVSLLTLYFFWRRNWL